MTAVRSGRTGRPGGRSLVVAACILASVAHAPAAKAENPRPEAEKPLRASLTGKARDAYESGELLVNNGDYAGAIAKYKQAYDFSKDPRLLFNMAVAEKSLHAYAQMQRHLEQYERETGPAIKARDKAAVDAALDAIRNLVGAVTVDANVAGAAVLVDGDAVGTTPLAEAVVLDLGKHTVVVQKADYQPATQAIEIAGGTTANLHLELAPVVRNAQLVVAAESGSTVVVDGTATRDRFDGAVPAGRHEVQVTADGRLPYHMEIELHEGETRMLQVTLTRREGHAPVWPWVVGGVVASAGLAVGGYFLLKPHDETTPVPSGTLLTTHFAAWGR